MVHCVSEDTCSWKTNWCNFRKKEGCFLTLYQPESTFTFAEHCLKVLKPRMFFHAATCVFKIYLVHHQCLSHFYIASVFLHLCISGRINKQVQEYNCHISRRNSQTKNRSENKMATVKASVHLACLCYHLGV